MSTVTHTTISLPPARAAQLRTIADARGGGLVEAIEHLLREEVKAGRLADELPGFTAQSKAGAVHLVIGAFDLAPLHPAHARMVSDLFRHAAEGMTDGRGNVVNLSEAPAYQLTIARKGRGIVGKVSCAEMGADERFSMTRGMALDFARQITGAADRAQHL